jgi:hypothetical protein
MSIFSSMDRIREQERTKEQESKGRHPLIRPRYRWMGTLVERDDPVPGSAADELWRYVHAVLGDIPEYHNELLIMGIVSATPHAYGPHPCVYRIDDPAGPCLPGRLIAESALSNGTLLDLQYQQEWKP